MLIDFCIISWCCQGRLPSRFWASLVNIEGWGWLPLGLGAFLRRHFRFAPSLSLFLLPPHSSFPPSIPFSLFWRFPFAFAFCSLSFAYCWSSGSCSSASRLFSSALRSPLALLLRLLLLLSRIQRNLFIHKARIPARRFSSSTSQYFKMFPQFASNEGYSASGLRYQSDGAWVTHPLPHSEFTRIRERTCDLTLALSHSPFAYYSYISSYSLLIIPSAVL